MTSCHGEKCRRPNPAMKIGHSARRLQFYCRLFWSEGMHERVTLFQSLIKPLPTVPRKQIGTLDVLLCSSRAPATVAEA